MAQGKIVVVGSLNMDLVVRTARLPRPGETVAGTDFMTAPGGKGANQAVAAARLAPSALSVAMIGRVGDDAFGRELRGSLQAAGVGLDGVETVAGPSGIAVIGVEASGQNSIIVAPGANGRFEEGDLARVSDQMRGADTVVLQLEVPLPVVAQAAALAASGGARVILNPAPALAIEALPLEHLSILVPNESEAEMLTGERDPHRAATALRARGVPTVIVTLGERGALALSEAGAIEVPSFPVKAVDTTAAGDAFVGALAVALTEGASLQEAMRFASAAGALAVTRHGAQPALPQRHEVEALIGS